MTSTTAAIPPHILPALQLPSPTISPSSSADNLFLYPQPLPRPTSHYLPFSTYSQPTSASTSSSSLSSATLSPTKRSRASTRPSSSDLSSLDSMGFSFKDKDHSRVKLSDIHVVRPGVPAVARVSRRSSSHGRFTLKGIKKKKSLLSLLSLISDATNPSPSSSATVESLYHFSPYNSPVDSAIPRCESPTNEKLGKTHGMRKEDETEEDDYEETDKYIRKNVWLKRHNMQLHPYPLDAPYMQAYDSILLDKSVSFTLFRRIYLICFIFTATDTQTSYYADSTLTAPPASTTTARSHQQLYLI